MNRRQLLRVAGLGVAGAGLARTGALAGCGGGDNAGSGGTKTIEMTWWGSTERHKRTQDAIDAFRKKHSNIDVKAQFYGWDGYWEKLATATAGGKSPDVIQMDYAYITEYARRSSLLALDKLIPKSLDLAGFSEDVLAGGKIDGKLFGVNAGINSTALVYNVNLLKQIGIEMPDHTMTWDGLAQLCRQIATKAPSGVVPLENAMADGQALEIWLRQRGKAMFTADGALGFEPADLTDWFTWWIDLVKAKGAATAELQATAAGDIQNSLLAKKKGVIDFGHSNQLAAYSAALKDDVALHMYPHAGPGAKPGQYLKPSMFLSISAKTKHQQEAATLVDALLTEPDIAAILGTERGIPPSTTIRAALKPKANPVEQRTYDYIDFVTDKVGALPPPQPLGAGEVNAKILQFAADQAGFGKLPIPQAVSKFFEDANKVLKK